MHRPINILLVTPSRQNHLRLKDILPTTGLALKRVRTLAEAQQALTTEQYDICLAAYDLPPSTGLELINPETIPLIILTEQPDPAVETAAFEAGAADYMALAQLSSSRLDRAIRYTVERNQAQAERERLLAREREQRELAEVLLEIGITLNATLDFDTILDSLLDLLFRLVPFDSGNMMLLEDKRVHIAGWRGYDQFGPKAVEFIENFDFSLDKVPNLQQMVQTGQPLIIPDTSRYPDWVYIDNMPPIGSWAGAPIMVQGETIAFFSLDKIEANFFKPEHVRWMNIFANQAGLALQNARLFSAETQTRQTGEALRAASMKLTAALDVQEITQDFLDYLAQIIRFDSACIFKVEQDNLRAIAQRGLPVGDEIIGQYFPKTKDELFSEILQTHQPILLDDAQTDPRFHKRGGTHNTRGWMGIPLLARGELIGILTVDSKQPHRYTPSAIRLTQTFANQAAIAIDNANLFKASTQHINVLDTIHKASLALTSSLDLQTVLDKITESTLAQFEDAYNVNIFLHRNGKLTFGAARHITKGRQMKPYSTPRPAGLTATVARRGEPIIVEKMSDHPLFENAPQAWHGSIIGLPLKIESQVVGVMNVAWLKTRKFAVSELYGLQLLGDQAAVAIENARLFEAEHAARQQAETLREETRYQLSLMSRLYELSGEFVSTLSVEQAATLVIEKIIEATLAHSAVLNLLDDDGNFLQAFTTDPDDPKPLPRPDGTTMTIYRTGQPIIINDAKNADVDLQPHLFKMGLQASIGLPLKAGHKIIGVLFVRYTKPHHFSRQEVETLFVFANQAAIAIYNARLYEQVQQHASDLQEQVDEQTFELQTFYKLAQALGHATQPGDIVRLALLHLSQIVHYDVAASLITLSETSGKLVIQSRWPLTDALEEQIKDIMCLTCGTLRRANPCHMPTIDVHYIHLPRKLSDSQEQLENLGSLAQVPLLVNNQTVGLLLIGTTAANQFGPEQARLLSIAADQAAEGINRVQNLIQAEHRRLENMVAHLPNGVILLDSDHNITLTNPKAKNYLQLLGKTDEDDRLEQLGELALAKILQQAPDAPPTEITAAGPPDCLLTVTARPVPGPDDNGWLLLIRDITEERAMQKQVQQQEQLAAIGQLAAGIAHDFNNILTGIIGYAELLQMESAISPSVQQDLGRITRQAQRAAHLVRQILDFSRQSISEKHPLEMVPFLKETIKLLERTIPENIKIEFTIKDREKNFTINADLPRMQQVLTNLAVNARDAMPAGGMLKITLARRTLTGHDSIPVPDMPFGEWIVLTMSDTGEGIAAEDLNRIFEPFFTTKETGKGTGLGLAQVYGIISQHEGYIRVHSTPGHGATFTLYLPALQTEQVPQSEQDTLNSMQVGGGEQILLVEDNPEVLEITQAMLEYLQYHPRPATNGSEAVELYEKHQDQIKLVITDVTMPDMSGIELAQVLHEKNPNISIIALTGYPQDTDKNIAAWRSYGIVDWLQKPVTLQKLADALSKHITINSP